MIFRDLIVELRPRVASAVEELFSAAYAHQTHPQDLLLVDQHGFHSRMLAHSPTTEQRRLSPYVIGPDEIGLAEATFYEFIDSYRKSRVLDKVEFEKRVAQDPEIEENERLTLQVEQSIYLRFWEADSLLKKYYQLSSLASGEPYDWYLNIPAHARHGSRHAVIRTMIRDRVKDRCPAFYALVRENYRTQLRNAIAHSQFYISGRAIRFLNRSSDPAAHAPMAAISFDDWYRVFHALLLLHSETIGAFRRYRERYKEQALANGNRIEVRIITSNQAQVVAELGVLQPSGRWVWRQNIRDDVLPPQD